MCLPVGTMLSECGHVPQGAFSYPPGHVSLRGTSLFAPGWAVPFWDFSRALLEYGDKFAVAV